MPMKWVTRTKIKGIEQERARERQQFKHIAKKHRNELHLILRTY